MADEEGKGVLYDVFGSDVEMSDDEEEEVKKSSSVKPKRKAEGGARWSGGAGRKKGGGEEEDEGDDVDDEDDDFGGQVLDSDDDLDDVAPKRRRLSKATARGKKKLVRKGSGSGRGEASSPSLKKKSRKLKSKGSADDEEEDGADDEDPDVTAAKNALKELDDGDGDDAAAEDGDSDDLVGDGDEEPEEAEKEEKKMSNVEKAFAAIKKGKRRKRVTNMEDVRLEAESLVTRMWKARDSDLISFKREKPALEKLKMLAEVEECVRKVDYREMLLQHKLLGALRLWLDPMPDGSLPNQTVRTRVLRLLDEFAVGEEWTAYLKESGGLGKVINFLSQKDTFEPNRREAKRLIAKWTRPIFETQTDYRAINDDFERVETSDRPARGRSAELIGAQDKPQNAYERALSKAKADKYYARIPRPVSFNFKKMPESRLDSLDDDAIPGRAESKKKANVERGIQRLKNVGKNSNSRAVNPSIEGRGML